MATVGFSAAGIANDPVSWLRKFMLLFTAASQDENRAPISPLLEAMTAALATTLCGNRCPFCDTGRGQQDLNLGEIAM